MAEPDFGRIKRNISKMIQMGAPESDIDSYVSQEGVTPEQLRGAASVSAAPMGSDGVSGDEIRARNAGNTRPQMALPDISSAYDAAVGNPNEQKAMADAYVQRERADSPIMMGVSDRVRQLARGVPVLGGALDEANAGVSYLTGGGYQKALDYQQARDRTFEAQHPKESTALQIGGGVASGLGSIGLLSKLVKGGSAATTIGRGVLTGTGIGAADGFARTDGSLADRGIGAAVGGGVGGVIGGLAPTVASGVSAGARKIADTLRTNKDIGALGMSRPAADVINRVMSSDGALGPTGQANINRAGPGAMLADAGPTGSGLLDMVLQRGGPGASTAKQAIEARATDASKAVKGALDKTLGQPVGLLTAENAIRTGSAGARKATYDAAYNTPIDYSAPSGFKLEDLLKRVSGAHIADANELMKLKGESSKQIMATIGQDGSVTYKTQPDVRQIDYITRALNQAAKSGDGQGALGGQTPKGAAYQNLARKIRDELRSNVPSYGTALDTAADPIARREALQFGSKLLSSAVTRDEVANTIKGMSKAELSAAKQGIRQRIDDTMANVTRVMSDPNIDAREAVKAIRDLSSKASKEKVSAIVGQREADALFSQLDEQARAFELRAATSTNSKTYARTALDEATTQMTNPGPIGLLKEGSPVKAGKRALQGLLSSGPDVQTAAKDKIYGEIATALTQKRGADVTDMMLKLQQAYKRKGAFDKGANALGLLSSGALSGGAFQATPRLSTR